MNDKLGIAAVAALLGAGLLTTKRFNKTMRAETFMAQAKQVNSLRANRINGSFSDYSAPLMQKYWLAVKEETAPNWWMDIFKGLSDEHHEGMYRIINMANDSSSYYGDAEKIFTYSEILWEADRINNRILSQRPEFVHANEVLKTALKSVYGAILTEQRLNPDMTYAQFARTAEGIKAAKMLQDAIQECNTTLGEEAYSFETRIRYYSLDKNAPKQDLALVLNFGPNPHPQQKISSYELGLIVKEATIIVPASKLSPIYDGREASFYKPIFTKDDVERIKEYALENKSFGFYTQIVSYNEFFKRNPEIKSVGVTKNDEKYYSVDLNWNNIPAGITRDYGGGGGGLVWDTEAFSSFTEAEGRDLTNTAIETAKKIIESAKKAYDQRQGQEANLKQQIKNEQREYIIKKLTEGFAQYDNLDSDQKGKMIYSYLLLVVGRGGFGNYSYPYDFGIDEYPVVSDYGDGAGPQIIKQYLRDVAGAVKTNNIDVSSLPVPASLKADAKATFEQGMNFRIQQAQRELESAQRILEVAEKEKTDGLNRL